MEKTLDERLKDLERLYFNLSESNSKLWSQMIQLTDMVAKTNESHTEFVRKVNESEKNTTKLLNDLRDNLLFLSAKGSKPS